jgi:hypothetical protein
MNNGLTGGAKAGYFFLGFFLSLIGFTIIWGVNKDRPTLAEALKFGIIGAWVSVVAGVVLSIALSSLVIAMLASYSGYAF